MHSVEKDTLGYQLKARPGTMYRDVSQVPVTQVAQALDKYMVNAGDEYPQHVHPEAEALWFYMMNHAVAEVQQRFDTDQPLGEYLSIVSDYQDSVSARATRMFYYILLITTRESRHLQSCAVKNELAKKYGQPFAQFQDALSGKGSDGAALYLRNDPPQSISIGTYCDALCDIFYNGKFSTSYGGQPWGDIANCIRQFVYGEYSAEMMLDTAFTLCHNNGPIFNKGMLYHHYDADVIQRILDVQRSGQIPQMVHEACAGSFVTGPMAKWRMDAAQLIPEMDGYVNWFAVEALGAIGNYHQQKNEQVAKYGKPVNIAKQEAEAAKAKLKAEMLEEAQKVEESANWFVVMPGVKVKKIQRSKAA